MVVFLTLSCPAGSDLPPPRRGEEFKARSLHKRDGEGGLQF